MKWTKKIFALAMSIALTALVLTSLIPTSVDALSIPPVVSISASPINADTTSTITAVAVDLSGSGIAWVKIYENGVKVKECSTSTCVYVAVNPLAGTYSYYAKASDNGGRQTTSDTVRVTFEGAPNRAPVLNAIGNFSVDEDELLEFIVSGSDLDGDALTYSAAGLPTGATFNAGTRTFSWTPDYTQAGTYNLNISVSDVYLSDSEVVTITVNNVNRAPVLDSIGNKTGNEGSELAFTISGNDDDGDSLEYSMTGLPAEAVLDDSTGEFSWTPDYDEAGNYSVTFTVSDGDLSDSETINVEIFNTNRAPVLNAIGNKSVFEGSLLEFLVNGNDPDGDSTTLSAVPVDNFDSSTGNFSWTPDFTQNGTYEVNFTITDGDLSDSEVVTITVYNVDVDAPLYSDLTENPADPATYAPGQLYEFNSTWIDDIAVDSVWINFSGVFYGTTNSGDVYTFTIEDLAVGTYSYEWFANDTSGNMNQTGVLTYTIDKAATNTTVIASPLSATYGDLTNFTCSNSGNLATTLYINGVDSTSEMGLDVLRGANSYNVSCFGIENENYTGSSDEITYVIDKAVPVLSGNVTSPITYESASDYSGSESNSGDDDLVYELYLDGNPVMNGSSVSDNSILGVGTHTYNYTTAGGENYTAAELISTLVVNQATPNLSISLAPNSTVAHGVETTASEIGCPTELELAGLCIFERDGTPVSGPDVQILPAGTYNYTYSTAGNENYTSATVTELLTVTKILPDLHLYIDGLEEDKNVTYTTETNASAFSTTSDVELYRNGAPVSDEDVATLGAGIYNYTAYAPENENYTSMSVTRIVIVEQATPVLSLDILPGNSVSYGTATNTTGSGCPAELTCPLTRNGADADAENGVEVTLSAGIYNYTYSTAGNENYTAAGVSENLSVGKIAPNLQLFLDGNEANDSIVYGTESNATTYSTTSSIELYRNGLLIANPDISTLGVGTYNFSAFALENENYTSANAELTLTVTRENGAVLLAFDPASPQDFGNTINATCSIVSGEGSVVLYRNGTDVTFENGLDVLLGAGNWDYICYMAETENYTAAEDNQTFVINTIAPDLHLYLNDAESDDLIVYGTESNASAVSSTSDIELYRNDVLVSDEEIATLGAGIYNYTAVAVANQNYSEGRISFNLTVTQAAPSMALNIAPSNSVDYGTETNVTGTCTAQIVCALSINGISASNPDISTLGAGEYNYTLSTAGNENYTSAEISENLTVNKVLPSMEYFLNGANDNLTITYLESVNASAYANGGAINMFRDGVDASAENGLDVILGAGTYTYEFNVTGDENHTDLASEFLTLVVNKATPVLNANLTSPITYGAASDYSGSESNSGDDDLVYELYLDGVLVDSGSSVSDNSVLGAGNHSYNYTTAGGENWTSAERTDMLEVTKIAPNLQLFLNGNEANDSIVYGTESNASAFSTTSDVELYRNGVPVSDEDVAVLGAGTYNYTAMAVENENYTSLSVEFTLIVTQATPVLSISITPSNNEVYGTATNTTGSGCAAELICSLARDGEDADAENGVDVVLGAGVYNYTYSTSGNENYTSAEISENLTITKATPVMTYSVNGGIANLSLEDPAEINATVSSDAGTAHMFRNGADADAENGINQTLHFGTYLYAFNVTGDENHTDVAGEFITVEVVDTTAPLIEFVNPTRLSGRYVINTFEMNVSATDLNLANITIYAWNETGDLHDSFTCALSPCDHTFVLPEGNFTFNASATDLSGNVNWTDSSDSREYDIDTIRPQVQFVEPTPANASMVDSDQIINVTASDVHLDSITVYLYDSGMNELSTQSSSTSPLEVTLDVSALGDGTYYYNATASDSWGWSNKTELRMIIVDTTAPLIDFIDPTTADGAHFNQFEANVSATDVNLANITINVYNETGLWASESSATTPFHYRWNSVSDGLYSFNATACDLMGHCNSTETRTIEKDTTKPLIDFVSPTPANASMVDSDQIINVTASDLHLDSIDVYLYDSGMNELVSQSSATSPFEVLIDVSALGDGTYYYNASAIDTFFRVNSTELRMIIVDTTAPIISFEDPTPADSAYLDDDGFSVNATATDDYLVNVTVYLYNSSGLISETTVTSAENFVEFDNLPDGVYEINATAVDMLGHESSTETREITLDGNAPIIQYVSPTPANGTLTNQDFSINVTAFDYHVSHIDMVTYDENLVSLGGYTKDDSMGDIWFANWPRSLSDGIYYYNASATDSAGHIAATELRMITVDKTGPNVTNLDIVPDSVYNTESVNISADVADLHGVASVFANITDSTGTSIAFVEMAGSGNSYSVLYVTPSTGSDADYNATIIATDSLGNINDSEMYGFSVIYGEKSIFNSWIDGIFYLADFEWDVTTRNVTNSSINDTTVNGSVIADINSSILVNSTLTDVTVINYCQVYDSTVIGGTCDHAYIDPSMVINSNTTGSTIINSDVTDTNATYSYIEDSSVSGADINGSVIISGVIGGSIVSNSTVTSSNLTDSEISSDSVVTDSNLTDSIVDNSTISGTAIENATVSNSVLTDVNITLTDLIIENATVINGTAYNGTFTYNGTTKTIDSDKALYYLVNFGPNASLSVSPLAVYTGDNVVFDASATTDLNLNESGDNIALTFTENLTYTYYGWNNLEGYTAFAPIALHSNSYTWVPSEPGNYSIHMIVSDVFGENSTSSTFEVVVSARPRSGGGGGGSACMTNWTCSEWSNCSDGLMTRNCTKINPRCAVNEPMPEVNMTCISDDVNNNETETNATETDSSDDNSFVSKITGGVIGAGVSPRMIGAIIFVAAMLIAGGILWLARKKSTARIARKYRRK